MDHIVIKVDELLKKAQELKESKMDYVELTLIEPDDELPACVDFQAIGKEDEFAVVCFEEINAAPKEIADEFSL